MIAETGFHTLQGHYLDAAFVVMIVGAGYGMYLLAGAVLGEQASPWPALASAVAYMYAPYFLTNVFIRGALAEVGAQALLPWVFWSFNRLLKHARPGLWLVPTALSLGGLAATHNITLLLLPPALVAYGTVLWWQAGRDRRRLVWAIIGLMAAMGTSAFFWLPVIGERQYLAGTAYSIARQFLPENAWTWQNFLDLHLSFEYTFAIPFQLGLIQLTLAVTGAILARRRDAEWLYWLGLVLAACLGISAWAVPVWLSSDVLLIAQFPWRLLALVSVGLALFIGGSLARLKSWRWQAAGGVALLALVVATNTPRLDPASVNPIDNSTLGLPGMAQFEATTAALGTTNSHEFMPRWATSTTLEASTVTSASTASPQLTLSAASAYEHSLQATSSAPFTLRLTELYFPGWRAYLDGQQPWPAYPSTNLGLLTVDVPAGTHQVRVVWQGTALEHWAAYATLAALLALTLFQLRQPRRRWAAALPALLLALGAVAAFKPLPPPTPITAPSEPFDQAGLRLLGYRLDQPDASELYLYPYWQTSRQPAPLRTHWSLTDLAGHTLSEIALTPYFGGGHSDNWPANTLADDAYSLPLPPGLPAGQYDLWLQLEPLTATTPSPRQRVATLTLGAVPQTTLVAPAQTSGARFGETIMLAGYDLRFNQKTVDAAARPLARPGDELEYTLYWRSLGPVAENYHGFIHLLDAHQNPLVKIDQLAGSWLRPPVLWDPFRFQADAYHLTIPANAPGGLYWPRLGLYRSPSLEQLPVQDAAGKEQGSSLDLPPIKIVPPAPRPPPHLTSARFGDLAALWGYDLGLPAGGLHAGETFTLTLYYRSAAVSTVAYTHFVHLSGAGGKVVAQNDAQPQQGVNPTSAWVPDEVIVDPIVLTVAADAVAGTYTLRTGLYDPAAGGARLAAIDSAGNELPDDTVILTTLPVAP